MYPHNIGTSNGGGFYGGVTALAPCLYTVEHFYTRNGILPEDDSELPKSGWFESAGYAGRTDTDVESGTVSRQVDIEYRTQIPILRRRGRELYGVPQLLYVVYYR